MKVFKAVVVFLCLMVMWPEVASHCQWINWSVMAAFAAVAIFLYRKDRQPCWSWIVVWLFAGLAKAAAEGHPMHTDMSGFEHYVRCYGAAFSRPLRILFALALCVWLFCGVSVLMIWK